MEMLRVKGCDILDGPGNPVMLKGTCVGGWMNMENFINGYPGTESGLREAMSAALGTAKGEYFFDRLLDYFLTPADLKFQKECGATVVRLPLNYRHFESDAKPFEYLEEGFRRLDRMLDWCGQAGLYAILDMHSVQGWQDTDWHSDNDTNHAFFWEHPHFIDRFIALWEEFARRYRGRAVVAGYNVMNEPICNAARGRFSNIDRYARAWDKINGVYRRVVESIRKIDPEHIIFLEGDYFSLLFEGLEPPFAENLVYSSHNYNAAGFGPGAYPGLVRGEYWDRGKQREVFAAHEGTQFARKHNVPLWIGEFGAVYNGLANEIQDRLRALDDQLSVFEQNGAHWTTWTYKDVGVMGWVTLNPQSDYMKIIAPSLEAKRLLDTDQWMRWLPPTPAKSIVKDLSELVADTIGDPDLQRDAVYSYLKQAALCGYVGTLMQPSFAKLFKGFSEHRLDEILSAFAFENCIINEDLIIYLKRHMSYIKP